MFGWIVVPPLSASLFRSMMALTAPAVPHCSTAILVRLSPCFTVYVLPWSADAVGGLSATIEILDGVAGGAVGALGAAEAGVPLVEPGMMYVRPAITMFAFC